MFIYPEKNIFSSFFAARAFKLENNNKMEIVIDCRETQLLSCIGDAFKYRVEQLPLGDILIGDYVIERKTIADLHSSIVDGRFIEQRERLRQLVANNPHIRVGYILEGVPNHLALRGGLINATTSLGMEFCVFISGSVAGTVAICAKIARGQSTRHNPAAAERDQAIKQNKIKLRNPQTVLEMALLNIPGVGPKTAAIIASEHESIAAFVAANCACSERVSARLRAVINAHFGISTGPEETK